MITEPSNESDLNTFIGIVLIAIVVSIYGYLYPDTINQSDTIFLEVTLDSKPDYDPPNGENVPNISFWAGSYSNRFDISHCALELIHKEDILKLNMGDSLGLLVDKDDLNNNNRITVCGIRLKNKVDILTLKNYNSCEKERWKEIFYLGLIFFAILIFLTIRWIFRN